MSKLMKMMLSIISILLISTCLLLLSIFILPKKFNPTNNIINFMVNFYDHKNDIQLIDSELYFSNNNNLIFEIFDLDINTNHNDKLFLAKKVRIEFDLSEILHIKKIIKGIEIDSPILFLNEAIHQQINNNYQTDSSILSYLLLYNIHVNNGIILTEYNNKQQEWYIRNFNSYNNQGIIDLNIESSINSYLSQIKLTIETHNNEINLLSNFKELPSKILIDNLLSDKTDHLKPVLQNLDILINGDAKVKLSNNLEFISAKIQVNANDGEYSTKDLKTKISHLKTDLQIINNKKFIFDNINILLDDQTNIKTKLNFTLNDSKNFFDNHLSSLIINYEIDNIKTKTAYDLWPNIFFGDIKNWVGMHFNDGIIKNSSGKIIFDKDFFANGELKKESIDCNINFLNTNFQYEENIPKIKNASGSIFFSSSQIGASFNGISNSSKILNANLKIPYNLSEIEINSEVTGPLHDLDSFIPTHISKNLAKKNIFIKDHKSQHISNVNIKTPISSKLKWENFYLNVKSKIDPIIINHKQHKATLENINFSFHNSIDATDIVAHFNVEKIPSKYIFTKNHKSQNIDISELQFEIDKTIIKSLNINKDIFTLKSNKFLVSLDLNSENDIFIIDLKDTSFAIPRIDFTKTSGTPLNIHFSLKNTNDNLINLDNLVMRGKNIKINGNIFWNHQEKFLTKLNLEIFKFNQNKNIIFHQFSDQSSTETQITADIIDLSNFNFKLLQSSNNNRLNKVILKAKQLKMKNDINFDDIFYSSECHKNLQCKLAEFYATIDHKYKISLQHEPKNNYFEINSENAELFLKAFGIYENIAQGSLKINFEPKFSNSNQHFEIIGTSNINDFYITKQSLMSLLLLKFTSLPDIFDQSQKRGLKMNSFIGNFLYKDSIFSLDSVLQGTSLKLTLSGKINLDKQTLNLQGNVIPSLFGINSAIKNIPLIGNVLTGGEESVMSATYKIRGSLDAPKTSVNPFSMLPLSYFKNIFRGEN